MLAAAAGRDDVAAVVALTPLVDGIAAGRYALTTHRPSAVLRSAVDGFRGWLSVRFGGQPVMMPVVGRPGERAAIALPGCYEGYLAIAGPTWRNETDARIGPELGVHRPARYAAQLRCPLLVQIIDFDGIAPPHAAAKAAFHGQGGGSALPVRPFRCLAWPGVVRHDRRAPGPLLAPPRASRITGSHCCVAAS